MKISTSLVFLLILLTTTWSCKKKDKEITPDDYKILIVGSWKQISSRQITYVDGVKKTDITYDLSASADAYTFSADGTFKFTEGAASAGYEIEGTKFSLFINPEGPDIYEILTFTKDQFVIQMTNETVVDGKTTKEVGELTYKKIK